MMLNLDLEKDFIKSAMEKAKPVEQKREEEQSFRGWISQRF